MKKPPDLSHISPALRKLALPISDLSPDPTNARIHGEKNLDAIKGSLRVYGQQKPIVVRKDTMTVVAGNGTLEGGKALGWTHIAANIVDMDAATAAGFAIADNRTGELAEWDHEALDKLLTGLTVGTDDLLDAMFADLKAPPEIELPPPPESVQENVSELELIQSQRRSGNAKTAEKNDTEKYLVLVYPTREAKEAALTALGLPGDERYIPATSVQLRLTGKAAINAPKAAPAKHSGACG